MSLKKGDAALVASRELKRQPKVREEKRFQMRRRLAKRDRDYAESGCASPVTVEIRGNRVIETRGQVCIASRCTHITHN